MTTNEDNIILQQNNTRYSNILYSSTQKGINNIYSGINDLYDKILIGMDVILTDDSYIPIICASGSTGSTGSNTSATTLINDLINIPTDPIFNSKASNTGTNAYYATKCNLLTSNNQRLTYNINNPDICKDICKYKFCKRGVEFIGNKIKNNPTTSSQYLSSVYNNSLRLLNEITDKKPIKDSKSIYIINIYDNNPIALNSLTIKLSGKKETDPTVNLPYTISNVSFKNLNNNTSSLLVSDNWFNSDTPLSGKLLTTTGDIRSYIKIDIPINNPKHRIYSIYLYNLLNTDQTKLNNKSIIVTDSNDKVVSDILINDLHKTSTDPNNTIYKVLIYDNKSYINTSFDNYISGSGSSSSYIKEKIKDIYIYLLPNFINSLGIQGFQLFDNNDEDITINTIISSSMYPASSTTLHPENIYDKSGGISTVSTAGNSSSTPCTQYFHFEIDPNRNIKTIKIEFVATISYNINEFRNNLYVAFISQNNVTIYNEPISNKLSNAYIAYITIDLPNFNANAGMTGASGVQSFNPNIITCKNTSDNTFFNKRLVFDALTCLSNGSCRSKDGTLMTGFNYSLKKSSSCYKLTTKCNTCIPSNISSNLIDNNFINCNVSNEGYVNAKYVRITYIPTPPSSFMTDIEYIKYSTIDNVNVYNNFNFYTGHNITIYNLTNEGQTNSFASYSRIRFTESLPATATYVIQCSFNFNETKKLNELLIKFTMGSSNSNTLIIFDIIDDNNNIIYHKENSLYLGYATVTDRFKDLKYRLWDMNINTPIDPYFTVPYSSLTNYLYSLNVNGVYKPKPGIKYSFGTKCYIPNITTTNVNIITSTNWNITIDGPTTPSNFIEMDCINSYHTNASKCGDNKSWNGFPFGCVDCDSRITFSGNNINSSKDIMLKTGCYCNYGYYASKSNNSLPFFDRCSSCVQNNANNPSSTEIASIGTPSCLAIDLGATAAQISSIRSSNNYKNIYSIYDELNVKSTNLGIVRLDLINQLTIPKNVNALFADYPGTLNDNTISQKFWSLKMIIDGTDRNSSFTDINTILTDTISNPPSNNAAVNNIVYRYNRLKSVYNTLMGTTYYEIILNNITIPNLVNGSKSYPNGFDTNSLSQKFWSLKMIVDGKDWPDSSIDKIRQILNDTLPNYTASTSSYNNIVDRYNHLKNQYNNLQTNYNNLQTNYNELVAKIGNESVFEEFPTDYNNPNSNYYSDFKYRYGYSLDTGIPVIRGDNTLLNYSQRYHKAIINLSSFLSKAVQMDGIIRGWHAGSTEVINVMCRSRLYNQIIPLLPDMFDKYSLPNE